MSALFFTFLFSELIIKFVNGLYLLLATLLLLPRISKETLRYVVYWTGKYQRDIYQGKNERNKEEKQNKTKSRYLTG